jgi:hypothetical protein
MFDRYSMKTTLVCSFFLLLVAPGCGGPSKAKIKGKLTKGGQPFVVNDKTQVSVTFAEDIENPTKQTYSATFKPADGTFTVEVPTGKYRARLLVFDHEKKVPLPVSANISKQVYELTHNQELEIDISK